MINIVDGIVSFFNPEAGMRRAAARGVTEVINGYDQGGASYQKKSMRGWITSAVSPKDDIDTSLETLRARSRDLFMNSPIGAAALKTAKTNVIGPGLKLKSHSVYRTRRRTHGRGKSNLNSPYGLNQSTRMPFG